MAQEDYFSSQTGQLAGTLLAKGDDKDDAAKAILLSVIQQFAKNAKEGLKQSVVDGSKDVANKWSGIMESLGSDYDNASEDRQNLKEYKRSPTKYLTKKAIENIDLVTEGKNFTYATRFGKNVTDAQRATLAEAITQEKLKQFENIFTQIKNGVSSEDISELNTEVVPENMLSQIKEKGPEIRSMLSKGEA